MGRLEGHPFLFLSPFPEEIPHEKRQYGCFRILKHCTTVCSTYLSFTFTLSFTLAFSFALPFTLALSTVAGISLEKYKRPRNRLDNFQLHNRVNKIGDVNVHFLCYCSCCNSNRLRRSCSDPYPFPSTFVGEAPSRSYSPPPHLLR